MTSGVFPITAGCPGSRSRICSPARVEPGEVKRDPLDFALWQPSRASRRGFALGPGPSRLAYRVFRDVDPALGDTFDIHGGGADLTFPHHENEIAQSEGATGHPVRPVLDAWRLRTHQR